MSSSAPEQQQQQQHNQQHANQQHANQQLKGNYSHLDFKVRTANKRHLDFDDAYELSNVNAPERSRWTEPWYFIQAADTQFGMIDSFVRHKSEPGWLEEIALSEALVDAINSMKHQPKFMIVCGDLVDAWPTNKQVRDKQIVDFKRIFARLNIPLVCVCGNHDVGNEPTQQSIDTYKRDFGDDYFYFTTNDVLFIVINSQFYQNRDFVKQYAREQDEWLESLLDKCKLFKYSIVFEHIPWFLNYADEDDDYFNIKRQVRLHWLDKFCKAGVTKIMCGHYHRNAGGTYRNVELVVTSAIGAQIGNDKSGARFVKMLPNIIEHKYFSIDEIANFDSEMQEWLNKDLFDSKQQQQLVKVNNSSSSTTANQATQQL